MKDLATKIRNAAAWDEKAARIYAGANYEPSATSGEIKQYSVDSSRHQHAQNAWAFEALEIAVKALGDECDCYFNKQYLCLNCITLSKIAALVPGGENV